MVAGDSSGNNAVIDAAITALKTEDINHIMAWIPEEHGNTVRNLFERTVCEQRIAADGRRAAVDWFFSAVSRFSSERKSPPADRTGGAR